MKLSSPDKANANLAVNMNRQLYAKVPGIMGARK